MSTPERYARLAMAAFTSETQEDEITALFEKAIREAVRAEREVLLAEAHKVRLRGTRGCPTPPGPDFFDTMNYGVDCVAESIAARQDDDTPLPTTELVEALHESVILQSHYAGLLNEYDGGQRRKFTSARDWIARLDEVREQ